MNRFYLSRNRSRKPEAANASYPRQSHVIQVGEFRAERPNLRCGELSDAALPALAGGKTRQPPERYPSARNDFEQQPPFRDEATQRSVVAYEIPDVILRGINHERVPLRSLLASAPLILNFVCTSCPAACPAMGAALFELQETLALEGGKVRIVSISLDPQHDTPERLKAYARHFMAGPEWQFMTGSEADSIEVQLAFGVYDIDKLNHVPVTFLRILPGKPWVRLTGLVTPDELLNEFRRLVSIAPCVY